MPAELRLVFEDDAPTCPECDRCGEPLIAWDDLTFVCPTCDRFTLTEPAMQ